VKQHLQFVDGVMLGREAYHNPWWLSEWDAQFFATDVAFGARSPDLPLSRESVEQHMVDYMQRQQSLNGTPWPTIARHMLGLRHGLAGARRWRQVWSDHKLKQLPPQEVMLIAQSGGAG
jgi:tRNA-dihydrouridine synthase A